MPEQNITPDPSTLDLDDTAYLAIPEFLWDIHDVAGFLRRCENTARKYIKAWDDTPEPLFSDGGGDIWDPRDWWAWAAKHNENKAKKRRKSRHANVGHAMGTKTRG